MKKHNFVNHDNYELINVLNNLSVRPFNPELIGSLRPQGKLEKEVISLEEDLVMNLDSMNKIEEDDGKTLSVKNKLFKRNNYGLALLDTGN